MIVSRTNFISSHTSKIVRVVGLSTALANARDLADWLGIGQVSSLEQLCSVNIELATLHGVQTVVFVHLQPQTVCMQALMCAFLNAQANVSGLWVSQGRQQLLCKRCLTVSGRRGAEALYKSACCCLDWVTALPDQSIIQPFKYVRTRTQACATCGRAGLWDRRQWRAVITQMGHTFRHTASCSLHLSLSLFYLLLSQVGLFNFRPSVRPVPLEVHIQGFPGQHYCPRMASMNKPTFQGTVQQYL